LADVLTAVTADADGLEVRWADDGSLTRITFTPLDVALLPGTKS